MNTMKQVDTWKDAFKLPFTNYWGKVFDSTEQIVFEFERGTPVDIQEQIVDLTNSKSTAYLSDQALEYKNTFIYINRISLISVRGWGHLTGSLKLHTDKAARIQDEFGEWIVKSLKGIK